MKKFEPILIKENELIISETLKNEVLKLEISEKLPALVKPFLPTLDSATIMGLSWDELHKLIKDSFQFPNASDQFNLDSRGLGKAYEDLKDFHRVNQWTFNAKPLTAKMIEAIKESNRVYTTNETQNEAYKLAHSLVVDLRRAVELKLIPSIDDIYNYRSALRISRYTGDLEVNIEHISNILVHLK